MTVGGKTSPLPRRESSVISDDVKSVGHGSSLVIRALYAPAAWLLLVVGLSTLVRGAIGLGVPSPWILPDEIVYSELAKSIAEGARPAVREVPVFGWGEIYPTLIAPAWIVFDDPVRAHHAALAINAFVMSLAAVPAYLLSRMFVSWKASLVVSAMTLLVPSMAYTGVLMTENAFYPVFLLAVLAIARVLRSPSLPRQGVALLSLGLVAFTRIQGVALVGAYAVAVVSYAMTGTRSERFSYLRRFLPSSITVALVSLGPVIASIVRGEGVFGFLGSRSGTFAAFHPHEIPQWFAFLTADLILYVAVAPAVATAIVVGQGFVREAPDRVRLFAALVLPTFASMLLSVSLVSASLDVDGTENLNERYVFYVVPLAFLGFALWAEIRLPRPRPWTCCVLAVCCALPVLLPIERLAYNAAFQSVALVFWLSLPVSGVALAACVAAFTVLCGAIWVTSRRESTGRVWLVVGVWMALAGTATSVSNGFSGSNFASAFAGIPATWVDDALPPDATASVVWDQRAGGPEVFDFWLMVTEFYNPSVGTVFRLGEPTYYEAFLPTVPIVLDHDARLLRNGTPVKSEYVLVTCRARVAGTQVAQSPHGRLRLVKAEQPLRLSAERAC